MTAELAEGSTPPPKPSKAQPTIPVLPRDPLQQIERKASACRRRLKAIDGPKITIDYAVGIDGKVTRSIASTTDELGQCLAKAVQGTLFEPKLVLGRKLEL